MPDPFDEQLRTWLGSAADTLPPSPPPAAGAADRLVAEVQRRRRRRRLTSGAGAALALVAAVGLGLALAGTGRDGAQRVNALSGVGGTGQVSTSSSAPANGGGGPAVTPPPLPPPSPGSTVRVIGLGTSPPGHTTVVGTTVAPPGTPPTMPPTATTVAGGIVVVTQDNGGTTVNLRVGQQLRVQLSGSSSVPWSQPVDSNLAVLQPRPSGIMPTVGSAIALYTAASPGQATVTSTQDPPCRHATPPCMIATRLFTLTVVVGP